MSLGDTSGEGPSFGEDLKIPEINWNKIGTSGLKWIIMGVVLLWIASGIYCVGPDEMGVVRRFGKLSRTADSGPNFHLPFPFEKVDTPKVTEVKRVEIGFRTVGYDGTSARYRQIAHESLMLSGDENIIDLDLIIQFKIKDAANYLFNVRNPEETVRHVAQAAIRQVIGQHNIDEALTENKFVIQEETKTVVQEILDKYDAGILVVAAQLQDVQPPAAVVDAFKDVASAKEDKNRLINQAQGYRNDIIPRTRGQAEKALREAEAYRAERIARAEGDVQKFLNIYKEYVKAPAVTEKRLYIETMEDILPKMKKYIIKTQGSSGLFNILNMQDFKK